VDVVLKVSVCLSNDDAFLQEAAADTLAVVARMHDAQAIQALKKRMESSQEVKANVRRALKRALIALDE